MRLGILFLVLLSTGFSAPVWVQRGALNTKIIQTVIGKIKKTVALGNVSNYDSIFGVFRTNLVDSVEEAVNFPGDKSLAKENIKTIQNAIVEAMESANSLNQGEVVKIWDEILRQLESKVPTSKASLIDEYLQGTWDDPQDPSGRVLTEQINEAFGWQQPQAKKSKITPSGDFPLFTDQFTKLNIPSSVGQRGNFYPQMSPGIMQNRGMGTRAEPSLTEIAIDTIMKLYDDYEKYMKADLGQETENTKDRLARGIALWKYLDKNGIRCTEEEFNRASQFNKLGAIIRATEENLSNHNYSGSLSPFPKDIHEAGVLLRIMDAIFMSSVEAQKRRPHEFPQLVRMFNSFSKTLKHKAIEIAVRDGVFKSFQEAEGLSVSKLYARISNAHLQAEPSIKIINKERENFPSLSITDPTLFETQKATISQFISPNLLVSSHSSQDEAAFMPTAGSMTNASVSMIASSHTDFSLLDDIAPMTNEQFETIKPLLGKAQLTEGDADDVRNFDGYLSVVIGSFRDRLLSSFPAISEELKALVAIPFDDVREVILTKLASDVNDEDARVFIDEQRKRRTEGCDGEGSRGGQR